MQANDEAGGVIAEFKRRRVRQLIATIPMVLAVFLAISLEHAGPAGLYGIPVPVIGGLAGVLLVAGIVFTLVNWRCPACRGYLGKGMNPRFCQKCGAQLQDA